MSDPDEPRDPDDSGNPDDRQTVPGPTAQDSNDGTEAVDTDPNNGDAPGSAESADSDSPESTGTVGGDDSPADDDEDDGRRRRLLLFLLLLLLGIFGAGIGTFVLDDMPDTAPGPQTPTGTEAPETVGEVSLTADADATLLRAEGVVPGDAGTSRLPLRNDGTATGQLAVVSFTVESGENGITSAEARVDDSAAAGELAENLLVRLSVRYSDGETVRVFGSDAFVPLADVEVRNRTVGPLAAGEEATVVFEWRLPTDTGNEVQSDTARFDVVFGLRSSTDETPDQ